MQVQHHKPDKVQNGVGPISCLVSVSIKCSEEQYSDVLSVYVTRTSIAEEVDSKNQMKSFFILFIMKSLKHIKLYSTLLVVMSYCALHRKDDSVLVREFCVRRRWVGSPVGCCARELLGLTIKGPWLALDGPILTLAALIGQKMLLSSCTGFNSGRKCGLLCALYWMCMVKVHLSSAFGSGLQQKYKIWYVKGMYLLKVV